MPLVSATFPTTRPNVQNVLFMCQLCDTSIRYDWDFTWLNWSSRTVHRQRSWSLVIDSSRLKVQKSGFSNLPHVFLDLPLPQALSTEISISLHSRPYQYASHDHTSHSSSTPYLMPLKCSQNLCK